MKRDVSYSHSHNVGEKVGSFCDVSIVELDTFGMDLDVELESQRTVLINKAANCSDVPNTAEVLPGEMICADNIIRRTTTAEAIGYDVYKDRNPGTEFILGQGKYDAENNEWEKLDKQFGQSTPEQLAAWLSTEMPAGLTREVTADGEDKTLVVKQGINVLYSFKYFGGKAGTYICGDEVRPFEPPQVKRSTHSETRVLELLHDNVVVKDRHYVELPEYADEFISHYIPTSHVERITIGGSAFFAPEEEA